ncbi:PLP-dependent aminotransferase family protein [Pantoea rodasii]|nr:PLP-dependent aminotransferase family protein [Pantoea rodasii]
MAKVWLEKQLPQVSEEEILVTPGIHSALVGLLTLLCRKGGSICVSDLIYPGLKAIASQLNITLQSLPCDEDGPLPRAFEHQCQTGHISALYINPTLQNPTTLTLPLRRREALADVASRYSIPVIEDEAYAALMTEHIASFSELVPELTWYITGLSKCFGPGLRTAFVKGPGKRNTQLLAGALRALNVIINPTLQNPTTLTLPLRRREALADVASRYSIPVIEDEAYAALMTEHIASFSELVPELTWYITGLSKCFGPGLRTAFVKGPGKRNTQLLAGALRALNVMASPITNALASQWIQDGTADRVLESIRTEAGIRQKLAADILRPFTLKASPEGFHLWLRLPRHLNWNPAEVAVKLRELGVSAVSSAAFCTDNNPPDALRICLGGAWSRAICAENLQTISHVLAHPEHYHSIVL